MKKILLIALLLTGCSVQLEDKRLDTQAVAQALNEHTATLNAIVTYIKDLQDTKVLPIPKQKEEPKK